MHFQEITEHYLHKGTQTSPIALPVSGYQKVPASRLHSIKRKANKKRPLEENLLIRFLFAMGFTFTNSI